MADNLDYVFENETELSAVNSILASIGQSPVTTVEFTNPEVYLVYKVFTETIRDVLEEGWSFNTDYEYPMTPDANGNIAIPRNALQLDVCGMSELNYPDTVVRDGLLYDRYLKTYEFEGTVYCNVKWSLDFDRLPSAFQRYIEARASVRAAAQLVNNSELYKLLVGEEGKTRANCLEYECQQGDYSMFGNPKGTHYSSFQPYKALIR